MAPGGARARRAGVPKPAVSGQPFRGRPARPARPRASRKPAQDAKGQPSANPHLDAGRARNSRAQRGVLGIGCSPNVSLSFPLKDKGKRPARRGARTLAAPGKAAAERMPVNSPVAACNGTTKNQPEENRAPRRPAGSTSSCARPHLGGHGGHRHSSSHRGFRRERQRQIGASRELARLRLHPRCAPPRRRILRF